MITHSTNGLNDNEDDECDDFCYLEPTELN